MKFIFSNLLFALCFLFEYAYSQGNAIETINEIPCAAPISREIKDLNKVVLNADSLIVVANSDKQRISALMTKANVYRQQGNFPLSIRTAMHADSLASYTLNFQCQAAISGFLAKSFRSLGLMNISSRYLDRAKKANDMIKDSELKQFILVDLLHEQAYHSLELQEYLKAGALASSAAKQIPKLAQDKKKIMVAEATNDQIMGLFEMNSGKLETADSLLNSALNKLSNINCSLKPRVYIALGEIAMKEGNFETAQQYLTLVDQYLAVEKDDELEKISYDSWSSYYKDTGNMENAFYYTQKSAELLKTKINRANILSASLLLETRDREEMYRFLYIISLSGIILFLVFAAYFLLVWKRKIWIQPEPVEVILESQPESPVIPAEPEETSYPILNGLENHNTKLNQIKISRYTETCLYRKLGKLETEKFFLEKNVKLDQVASMMGTNSKYVSYIIQKYRHMDFYEFIQHKRIEYFLTLVKTSPELLDFKLAYLAEKCGYSSLSKFSTSFKAVTGMPPSTYINLIKKELNS